MDHLAPRIIAFGCSFTKYIYPTYADILQATNIGWSGSGNEKIFYHLLQYYKSKQLKDYDIVLLQWSSPYRFDYKSPLGWIGDGNITKQPDIWEKTKSWYNENYELEKTINYIVTANALLEKLGLKVVSLSLDHIVDDNFKIDYNNLLENYKGNYEYKNTKFIDWHPTILQHLNLAKNIAKGLGIKLDSAILSKCHAIHREVATAKQFKEYAL